MDRGESSSSPSLPAPSLSSSLSPSSPTSTPTSMSLLYARSSSVVAAAPTRLSKAIPSRSSSSESQTRQVASSVSFRSAIVDIPVDEVFRLPRPLVVPFPVMRRRRIRLEPTRVQHAVTATGENRPRTVSRRSAARSLFTRRRAETTRTRSPGLSTRIERQSGQPVASESRIVTQRFGHFEPTARRAPYRNGFGISHSVFLSFYRSLVLLFYYYLSVTLSPHLPVSPSVPLSRPLLLFVFLLLSVPIRTIYSSPHFRPK